MMDVLINNQYWSYGSAPDIRFTLYYERERSGTDMRYRFRWVFHSLNTPQSGFGWPIYATVSLDGSIKLNGITLKGTSPMKWYGTEISYQSDWVTVSNKLTGSVSYRMTLFSGSGMERTQTWTGTLAVEDLASSFSVSDVTIGNALTVTIDRLDSSYHHTVYLELGLHHYTRSDVATTLNYTVPMEWCNNVTTSTQGSMAVKVTTYDSNGVQVGQPKIKSVSAKVPSSVVPGIGVVLSAVNGFNGQYLRGRSRLKIESGASGSYGSSVTNITYSVGGSVLSNTTEQSFETDVLSSSGSIAVSVGVTDSRGRTASFSGMINVINYAPPSISANNPFRCNASGTFTEGGTYANCKASATYDTSVVGNDITIKAEYRELPNGFFLGETILSNGVTSACFDGNILLNKSYSIRIYATDSVGETAEYYGTISSSANYMLTAKGKKFCFGGYVDENKTDGLQVVGDLHVTGSIDKLIPEMLGGVPFSLSNNGTQDLPVNGHTMIIVMNKPYDYPDWDTTIVPVAVIMSPQSFVGWDINNNGPYPFTLNVSNDTLTVGRKGDYQCDYIIYGVG